MKGIYVLILYNSLDQNINVGKLGLIKFKKGYYLYFGSAKGRSINLKNRIKRHIKLNKYKIGNIHWHIDYLLVNKNFKIDKIFIKETLEEKECDIINKLYKNNIIDIKDIIENFGNTDCNCKGHLIYINSESKFHEIIKILENNGYKEIKIEE